MTSNIGKSFYFTQALPFAVTNLWIVIKTLKYHLGQATIQNSTSSNDCGFTLVAPTQAKNQAGAAFLLKRQLHAAQHSFRTSGKNSYAAQISTARKTHRRLAHNCGQAVRTMLLRRKTVAATTAHAGSDHACKSMISASILSDTGRAAAEVEGRRVDAEWTLLRVNSKRLICSRLRAGPRTGSQ